jgi:hypothetical protein
MDGFIGSSGGCRKKIMGGHTKKIAFSNCDKSLPKE